jgi:hypothetical protein
VNALTTLDYPPVARQKRGMIIAGLRDGSAFLLLGPKTLQLRK